MGPIAHTRGWSKSRSWDPIYSGGYRHPLEPGAPHAGVTNLRCASSSASSSRRTLAAAEARWSLSPSEPAGPRFGPDSAVLTEAALDFATVEWLS
jgi:hypothetical protein